MHLGMRVGNESKLGQTLQALVSQSFLNFLTLVTDNLCINLFYLLQNILVIKSEITSLKLRMIMKLRSGLDIMLI